MFHMQGSGSGRAREGGCWRLACLAIPSALGAAACWGGEGVGCDNANRDGSVGVLVKGRDSCAGLVVRCYSQEELLAEDYLADADCSGACPPDKEHLKVQIRLYDSEGELLGQRGVEREYTEPCGYESFYHVEFSAPE